MIFPAWSTRRVCGTGPRLEQGARVTLRDFHDYVWSNGNVPLALQRWELQGWMTA